MWILEKIKVKIEELMRSTIYYKASTLDDGKRHIAYWYKDKNQSYIFLLSRTYDTFEKAERDIKLLACYYNMVEVRF